MPTTTNTVIPLSLVTHSPNSSAFPKQQPLPSIWPVLCPLRRHGAEPNKEGEEKPQSSAEPSLAFEPAVERSVVVNQEGLDKVRPALASESNEWVAMVSWPASRAMVDMTATEISIHLHAL